MAGLRVGADMWRPTCSAGCASCAELFEREFVWNLDDLMREVEAEIAQSLLQRNADSVAFRESHLGRAT